MIKKQEHILAQFFITFIMTSCVVFALCFIVQFELMHRCENYVGIRELSIKNVSKFFTIEQLENQLQKDPRSYILNIRLASIYEELGEYDKANKYYINALDVSSRSNFALYRYSLFCAKQNLYALSASYAEELSGSGIKIATYKACVYEAIADGLYADGQYEAAVKAYQVSYKYARSIKNFDSLESIKDKFANSYIALADLDIQNNNIRDAIVSLKNSIKIKDTPIANYKLALVFDGIDRITAEKYMFRAFDANPYIVNPYIYNKLLSDLIKESKERYEHKNADYYSMKLKRLNKKLQSFYVYKDDLIISDSHFNLSENYFSKNKNHYLVFNLKNNTKQKIPQLYVMVEIFDGSNKFVFTKKIIKKTNHLKALDEMKNINVKLSQDFKFDNLNKNPVVVKFYAKKRVGAPWAPVKIDTIVK